MLVVFIKCYIILDSKASSKFRVGCVVGLVITAGTRMHLLVRIVPTKRCHKCELTINTDV